ncbi:pectinesterase-like [Aristolochia californica]|uniref:pectinesterase-like n=1 Tax=Aristolochia californica TaxID=171875 RepID=UPI0035DAA5DA
MPFSNIPPERIRKLVSIVTTVTLVVALFIVMLGLISFRRRAHIRDISPSITVAQDGSGDFTTVIEAIAAAPSHSKKYFGIRIKAGVYNEIIRVPHEKTRLALMGEGTAVTFISFNRSERDGWAEDDTATVGVTGGGFVAMDISFENSAHPSKGYAVALSNSAHRSAFQRCSFNGSQRVIRAVSGTQFYGESDIYGAEDVIAGNAAAVFQKCIVHVRKALPGSKNVLTRQTRDRLLSSTGFVFHDTTVVAAAGFDYPGPVYLGYPGRAYARVVFMQCYLSDVVSPQGWLLAGVEHPETLYYGEYNNTGPGANTKKRATMRGIRLITTASMATHFTVASFLEGKEWLPRTTVKFVPGFL